MASNRKVMVLAGDGIGQEVMHANMQVMEWLAKHRSLGFDVSEGLVGGVASDVNFLKILGAQKWMPALENYPKGQSLFLPSLGGREGSKI